MAYNIVGNGFRILLENGLVEILVFALIFAIVYGILMNVNLFGDENAQAKKFNAVIALVLGALSILPHYVMPNSRFDVVRVVSEALPQTMLVLVVILGILILLGMFGWKIDNFQQSWLKPVVALVLLGIVLWIFIGATGGRLPNWLMNSQEILAIVVALGVFGGIIYFVIGKDDEE